MATYGITDPGYELGPKATGETVENDVGVFQKWVYPDGRYYWQADFYKTERGGGSFFGDSPEAQALFGAAIGASPLSVPYRLGKAGYEFSEGDTEAGFAELVPALKAKENVSTLFGGDSGPTQTPTPDLFGVGGSSVDLSSNLTLPIPKVSIDWRDIGLPGIGGGGGVNLSGLANIFARLRGLFGAGDNAPLPPAGAPLPAIGGPDFGALWDQLAGFFKGLVPGGGGGSSAGGSGGLGAGGVGQGGSGGVVNLSLGGLTDGLTAAVAALAAAKAAPAALPPVESPYRPQVVAVPVPAPSVPAWVWAAVAAVALWALTRRRR